MCNNNSIAYAVGVIVMGLVKAQQMFTAYDVTTAIRSQVGQGVNIKHSEVRDEVHGYYRRGLMGSDYERTSVNIPSVNASALVYHNYNDDPQTYQPTNIPNKLAQVVGAVPAIAAAPTVSTVAAQVPTATTVRQSVNSSNGSNGKFVRHLKNNQYQRDSRGRIRTPKNLMAQAGFNAGDTAFVVIDKASNRISVRRSAPSVTAAGSVVKPMTVDEYNNLLFKAPLQAASYQFSVDRDGLTIAPAP